MPKRNTYHSRGDFFWAKQEDNETPEEHWKNLTTLEKNCGFQDIKQEDLLISKFITSITDKKLRNKITCENALDLKTTVELVTQHTYNRRHKQSTITPALAKDKEIKQEPIQKIQAKQNREYRNQLKKSNCGFCLRTTKLDPTTQLPVKNGKLQKLPENREFCTGLPRKTKPQYKKNQLPRGHNIRRRQRRKRA